MPEMEPPRLPDRYCLLIDQGNSRLKWIVAIWTASSGQWDLDVTTFGEGNIEDLEAFFDSGEMQPPEEILVCSVASPDRCSGLRKAISRHSSADLRRVQSEEKTCGISNGYHDPQKLGDDRWMAVVGAACHYGLPLVVMDLGTATTLDAVDDQGRHIGGLIIPGPGTMLKSLDAGTALNVNPVKFPGRLDARSGEPQRETGAGIQWGVVSAQTSLLQEFTRRVRESLSEESKKNLKVLLTGGAANVIIEQSDCQLIHDPLLVFKGILCNRFGPGKS